MDELNKTFREGYNIIINILFEEQHESFIKIAYKFLEDKDDAIDAVGDVYAKLAHKMINENYRFPNNDQKFKSYVREMLINRCLDILKKRKNHIEYLINQNNQFSEQDFIEPQLNTIINEILKPRELKILELHLEGYKNKEIASRLGLSSNTIRNNISVSKKKLKEKYNEYFQ